MSAVEKILERVLALPQKDRAEIVNRLLISLESTDEPQGDVQQAWQEEIERRLESVERGDYEAFDWEEVRAEIEADLRKRTVRSPKP